MGLIPLNERVLTPPDGFQSVESMSGDRQLAWPLSEMVGKLLQRHEPKGLSLRTFP